jgi:hydrogenase large subunit
MAVAHYLEALAWQREVVKLHAIFGGKNPHPNFVVGGVPNPISLNSDSGHQRKTLAQVRCGDHRSDAHFVEQVYLPDTLAIAGFYKDWFERGEGVGNFLATATSRPARASATAIQHLLFPRGRS